MATYKFLSDTGLSHFFNKLKDLFATKTAVADVESDTNTYILNVDYSTLEFDTTEIVE